MIGALQISEENTCGIVRSETLFKQDSGTGVSLQIFSKLIRASFLQGTTGRFLLSLWLCFVNFQNYIF